MSFFPPTSPHSWLSASFQVVIATVYDDHSFLFKKYISDSFKQCVLFTFTYGRYNWHFYQILGGIAALLRLLPAFRGRRILLSGFFLRGDETAAAGSAGKIGWWSSWSSWDGVSSDTDLKALIVTALLVRCLGFSCTTLAGGRLAWGDVGLELPVVNGLRRCMDWERPFSKPFDDDDLRFTPADVEADLTGVPLVIFLPREDWDGLVLPLFEFLRGSLETGR